MGGRVGGHRPTTLSNVSKDSLSHKEHFDACLITELDRARCFPWSFNQKTSLNLQVTGVKIAWVATKSDKYPLFYISK